MFDLEQSIAEWRRQMLAAGIKTPVPMEELESHLREEIEEQVKLGMGVQQAFEMTVSQIGHANELKAEFAKDQGLVSLLSHNKSTKTCWLWALFWVALCSWVFYILLPGVVLNLIGPNLVSAPMLILAMSYVVIYGVILFGSVRYFRSVKTGRNFFKTLEYELFNNLDAEHRKRRADMLFLGWFAVGFMLYWTVNSLGYFDFFSFHPAVGITSFYSPTVPAWENGVILLKIFVLEAAIWSLAKASRDKVSRLISLVGCVSLMLLAFIDYFYLGDAHPLFPMLENVFNEIEPYRAWFQTGKMLLLWMPAFFVMWWEWQRFIHGRDSAPQKAVQLT